MDGIWTDADKKYLAAGKVVAFRDTSLNESDEDNVVLDGIKCRFMGRDFRNEFPRFMRYDKFMEKEEFMKTARFVDEWGFVPYELM